MEKVKWGIIGCGGIARRRTIPGMMACEKSELVAVMDLDQKIAAAVAAEFHVPRVYETMEELLRDPEIEAVYIASPVVAHKKQALAAIAAKKHILLEKPIALTPEEGDSLIADCKENELLFASGFMMRYHAYHQKARELIAAGDIGKVVSMHAQLTCWFPDMAGNWRQSKASAGGGALTDMGVHCIDLMEHISGSRVTRVGALISTQTFHYEVEDSAGVLMQFEGGAFGTVDANFNIPDEAAEGKLEIYGTKGSICMSGTISQAEGGQFKLVCSDPGEYEAQQNRDVDHSVTVEVEFGNMYTKEMDAFSDSIRTGAPVFVPASDAVHVQRVVEAAYRSGKSGKFVELERC